MTDFLADVERCLEALKNGGIILYPTDTVWGLGCDATNKEAVEKLYQLKHRPGNKSMVVLMADEREVLRYVSQVDLQIFDYLKTVSRPTTVIYNGAIGIAENVINGDGTLAIRLVQEPFCKTLIKRFRKPVVATSANISGDATPSWFGEISDEIKSGVDYVVNYRQDDATIASPSNIIQWKKDGSVHTIR